MDAPNTSGETLKDKNYIISNKEKKYYINISNKKELIVVYEYYQEDLLTIILKH